MGTRLRILLQLVGGLAITLLPLWAGAAELRFIEVDRDSERNEYRLKSITWFDADLQSLYDVLRDYDQFFKFHSSIVESRNLEPDTGGRPEYYTRMEGCIMMFCKSFIRIGYLDLEPMSSIEAHSDPERSDFKRSWERWELRKEDGGTVLEYEFEMIPAFWVPPVVGPYFMKRALRSGGARAVDRIEALARGEEPPR